MNNSQVIQVLVMLAEGQSSLEINEGSLNIIVSRVLFGENGPILPTKLSETIQYLTEHYLVKKEELFEVRIKELPVLQQEDAKITAEQVCLIVQQTLGIQEIRNPANRSLVRATCSLFEKIGKTSAWYTKAQEMMAL